MLIPTKILVPTDFSEYSDKALSQALDIAQEYKAKVYVLHVVHEKISHGIDDYGLTPQSIKRMETKMVNGGQKDIAETD
ncbi:MAG: universal stress protein [Rhodopseudomonas palustris]|nr:universal stress protein [Rhodopseudomonas palustris]